MFSKDLKSAVHVGIRVMGAFGLLFGQLLDPLLQEIVLRVEDDAELRTNLLVNF